MTTLEARVAELVSVIVARTEAAVESAFSQALDVELARRNGHEPALETSTEVSTRPATKVCTRCGETKTLDEFSPDRTVRDGRRGVCRACQRERARASYKAAREPEPEEPRPVRKREAGFALVARSDVVDGEGRRRLLDELRANGVEYVERDGREFRVLRLPSFRDDASLARAHVAPRRARGVRLA